MAKAMERLQSSFLALLVAVAAAGACRASAISGTAVEEFRSSAQSTADLEGPIHPIPAAPKLDAHRVALGRRLFFDPALSHDDSVSCATCHDLDRGGVDGRPHPIGIRNQVGSFNTPTVFNAALNFRQFWDGRADTLEAQIEGPVRNPRELGSSFEEVIGKLERDPTYLSEVRHSYGAKHLTKEILCDAIASYERSLVLPGSRFDKFLAGVEGSIDADERQGFELFKSYGCANCHQGSNVGGNMFERFGVARDYFAEIANPSPGDLGRYNLTGREEDRHVFRVPSLRLATLTAPYLHDGSIQSLQQTIRLMGRFQLGRELADADVKLIEMFLRTLVGSSEGVTFAAAP